jgi:hypothetical protein
MTMKNIISWDVEACDKIQELKFAYSPFLAGHMFSLHLKPEYGENIFLWNVRELLKIYTALYFKRYNLSRKKILTLIKLSL